MTVRCLPEQPRFESAAEAVVWQRLHDDLPDGSVLAANVAFSDRHGDCEADLIVAVPGAGFAVVEVKGGHVTHDGTTWRQAGGGRSATPIDPVRQARRAKYALRGYLDRSPAWAGRCQVRLAHLVAFPYFRVPADFAPPDCPRWMVIDETDLADAVQRVLTATLLPDDERPLATPAEVDDLWAALTGRLLGQRELVSTVREHADAADLLTAEQAVVLDHLRRVPRVEVRGGAGSGKTWLAVEKARRLARDGARVALMCYSRGLAAYLRRRVELMPPGQRPAYVGTFHGLGERWGAPPGDRDDSDFWERRLPAAMVDLAARLPEVERYDAIVLDEAQDFADAWWPAVLSGLRDPVHGGLYVFSDEGQRVFARYGRPPVELVPVELAENLRNTKQIAQTFGSLTTEQMRLRGGDGPPVRFVACATEEAVSAADDAVVGLLEDGWASEHVALLTTGHRHPVQRERVEARGQDGYWASYWETDDVFYGHVLGFKGLERPAVVVAVNGFGNDHRAREKLYVALSRARDLLVVCGDLELIRAAGGEGVVRRLSAAPASPRLLPPGVREASPGRSAGCSG
ncbi:MAG TPA: NERD domain-containing protein [Actinomycetes bacterium]|nr:NERD domain-containing protein [Actinomycetes bacterium]